MCYTKRDCRLEEARNNDGVIKNINKCRSRYDNDEDELRCVLEAYGLNKEQSKLFINIFYFLDNCDPNRDRNIRKCADKCNPTINGDCSQMCGEVYQLIEVTCLAKFAKISNFDVNRSAQCANSCNQITVSEVFDCEYSCKKEVYDILINMNKSEISNKPSSSQESKPKENPANKSTNSNGSTDGKSGEEDPNNKNSNRSSSTEKDPKPSTSPQSGTSDHSSTILSVDYTPLYNVVITTITFLFI